MKTAHLVLFCFKRTNQKVRFNKKDFLKKKGIFSQFLERRQLWNKTFLKKNPPCLALKCPFFLIKFRTFLNFLLLIIFYIFWSLILYFNSVVHQFYQTRVIDEFVLRGNSATLKCLVPSFVADFIIIESWVDEEGKEIFRSKTNEEMGKDCYNKFFFFN